MNLITPCLAPNVHNSYVQSVYLDIYFYARVVAVCLIYFLLKFTL